jgi:branched-chain amino acid transport system permease protein
MTRTLVLALHIAGVAAWLGANFDLVVPYLIMIVALMVRPYGLFGTKEVIRV